MWSSTSGVQAIATGGTVSAGSTSTYIATASVAASGAVPPESPWVLVAAAGASGGAGPAGATGAASVVPGPQGPIGPSCPLRPGVPLQM